MKKVQIVLTPELKRVIDFKSKCREKIIIVSIPQHNTSAKGDTDVADRGTQIGT